MCGDVLWIINKKSEFWARANARAQNSGPPLHKILDPPLEKQWKDGLCGLSRCLQGLRHCLARRPFSETPPAWSQGTPSCGISSITAWYSCAMSSVIWDDQKSQPFSIKQGVRQGGMLSPVLWCIFVQWRM